MPYGKMVLVPGMKKVRKPRVKSFQEGVGSSVPYVAEICFEIKAQNTCRFKKLSIEDGLNGYIHGVLV